ncbi:helix-turn-helix domain-containing protein [Laribacter hongkongensis]|uniref:helix-turn-helix domain-containing protein n=1 Tax=Laribacter hongkongensis TaxID=168471 RepID=UPI001EFC6598|nr:helix-turn-helix transcriptional regulator [Laribacter hongkongensis]MCG9095323.1 helix-turn-helix domain-containing protein [Laribacter hongkongensis]
MKLTPLGLCVRQLRLELGLTLKTVAAVLGVSSAYLSAVELGDKQLTNKLADQILAYFAPMISKEKFNELQGACAASLDVVPISSLESEEKILVAAFARRLSEGHGVPDDVLNWLKKGQ